MEQADYDVVIDCLQRHYDQLWTMTQGNMRMDMFNIMDQIRLEQMDQLKRAMALWKQHNE